jgi:hypothetical protein
LPAHATAEQPQVDHQQCADEDHEAEQVRDVDEGDGEFRPGAEA